MKYKIKSKQLIAKGQKGLTATQDSLLLHNASNELEQAIRSGKVNSVQGADTFLANQTNNRHFSSSKFAPNDIVSIPLVNSNKFISIPKFKKPTIKPAINSGFSPPINRPANSITLAQLPKFNQSSNTALLQPRQMPELPEVPIDNPVMKHQASWLNGNAVASHLGETAGNYMILTHKDGSTSKVKTNDNLQKYPDTRDFTKYDVGTKTWRKDKNEKPANLIVKNQNGGNVFNITQILQQWKK